MVDNITFIPNSKVACPCASTRNLKKSQNLKISETQKLSVSVTKKILNS